MTMTMHRAAKITSSLLVRCSWNRAEQYATFTAMHRSLLHVARPFERPTSGAQRTSGPADGHGCVWCVVAGAGRK